MRKLYRRKPPKRRKRKDEQPKAKTQEDIDREWQEGIDKMFAFIQESVDYDDEDPVCLDNLGQAYYRVTGEKDKAKEWFEKAHAEKDSQIDTLWFLSRYDLEADDKAAAIAKLEKALDGRFSPLNFCTKDMVREEVERLKK